MHFFGVAGSLFVLKIFCIILYFGSATCHGHYDATCQRAIYLTIVCAMKFRSLIIKHSIFDLRNFASVPHFINHIETRPNVND
jgi:hypothetical protein